MNVINVTRHAVLAVIATALLSSCAAIDRLKNIGQAPNLSAIDNPTSRPGYKPVQMPMPAAQPASYNPNSLWRNGSRAFFKDQRAHQIGDILTVKVNITDQANITDETQRTRTSAEDSGITNFFGKSKIPILNSGVPGRLLTADSTSSSDGKGSVARQEALQTNVAGVVTQVLPNGNLVIEGKQEIRVNFEMRELIVGGVIRPEDIESDNTIELDQNRPGAHFVWRPRPAHRCAAAALWPAIVRRDPAVLVSGVKYRLPRRFSHLASVDGVNDAAPGNSPAGGRGRWGELQNNNDRRKAGHGLSITSNQLAFNRRDRRARAARGAPALPPTASRSGGLPGGAARSARRSPRNSRRCRRRCG